MPNKIVSKIEFSMRHILHNLQPTIALTTSKQSQRVLIRHQIILISMNNQYRTIYCLQILLIIKCLLQHQTSTSSIQITRHFFQRYKRTQQNCTIYPISLSYSQPDSTSNRPPEYYQLISCYLIRLQKLNYPFRIILYINRISLSLIDAIASIFHGEYRIPSLKINHPQELKC